MIAVMRLEVVQLAAIEPSWSRLAVPFMGVVLFAAIVSFRQKRAAPVPVLIALTILLGLWLFGAGLVWSKRWPSMVRSAAGWTNDTGAWEWTALLAVAYISVGFAGASLRAISEDRPGHAWGYALIGLAGFAGWSAAVRYSVALAVIGGAMVLIALAADAITRPPLPRGAIAAPPTTRPVVRAVTIALVAAVAAFVLIVIAIAAVVPTGG